jgi:molecular chaperone DnaK (HSP70)
MVGGTTQIPLMQQMVATIFEEAGNVTAMESVYNPADTADMQLHPNFAVVLGATIQSALMMAPPTPSKLRSSSGKAPALSPMSSDLPISVEGMSQNHSLVDDIAARSILDSILLMDSLPTSYGIRTLGGVMVPVLRRGTNIPCRRSIFVTTNCDNQTEMKVAIYEGDQKLCRQNHIIGTFEITGIRPLSRGEADIEVNEFSVCGMSH